MALVFPTNPTNGQTYTAATGVTYTYSSTTGAWSATGQPVDVPAGASAAQAAAGTSTTVWLPPAYGTPKDGPGMAGATLLPAGTDAQRPGVPIAGMIRFSTTNNELEVYDGSSWVPGIGPGSILGRNAQLVAYWQSNTGTNTVFDLGGFGNIASATYSGFSGDQTVNFTYDFTLGGTRRVFGFAFPASFGITQRAFVSASSGSPSTATVDSYRTTSSGEGNYNTSVSCVAYAYYL